MERNLDADSLGGLLAVPVANSVGTGTGFLARSRGDVAFYTVAHNLGPYPGRSDGLLVIDGWRWLDRELEVLVSGADNAPVGGLPIFLPTDDQELPEETNLAFTWLSPEQGRVTDAARFDPQLAPQLVQELERKFDVVDLDAAATQVEADEPLFCLGYPAADAPHDGPRAFDREASRCEGAYLGRSPHYDWATMRALQGFSGGPVFTQAGQFAGMVAGSHRRTMERTYDLSWLVKPVDLIALGPFLAMSSS